jgi:hypothetical protein
VRADGKDIVKKSSVRKNRCVWSDGGGGCTCWGTVEPVRVGVCVWHVLVKADGQSFVYRSSACKGRHTKVTGVRI